MTVQTAQRPVVFTAMQFNGLDDYLAILDWMKASGDTNALADEIQFRTPVMLICGPTGWQAASPGDWVVRDLSGAFSVLRAP